MDFESRYADLGDVRLHYVEQGSGPLVLLLHGFPEFWYSWRNQIPALAEGGFRVVAPDMRGYNLSGKPSGVGAYRLPVLAQDVASLIRFLGAERAAVVGHDWGAAVAYGTAMFHPEVVERLAILNVPHPQRMLQGLRTPRQLRKSWYMFFFQLPRVPEAVAARDRYEWFRRQFEDARPGAFTAEDVDRYVEAWSQPGAVSSGMNYYRAAFRQTPRQASAQMRRIEAPVLVIWGERDKYLGAELAEPDHSAVPNVRVERLSGASHWVQHDEPGRVNELLREFLSPVAGRAPQSA